MNTPLNLPIHSECIHLINEYYSGQSKPATIIRQYKKLSLQQKQTLQALASEHYEWCVNDAVTGFGLPAIKPFDFLALSQTNQQYWMFRKYVEMVEDDTVDELED